MQRIERMAEAGIRVVDPYNRLANICVQRHLLQPKWIQSILFVKIDTISRF